MSEYFEDYCTTQRVVGVYFLRAEAKLNLHLELVTNINTACRSVSLYRQLKTRLASLRAVQGYSPIQTHYTNQSK